ncbi:MAG: hypothetical protein FJ319_08745 [SAR202 cluster bacterium]|nr:hypothetical protein [SAR202 cluster bacterium]
MKVVPSKRKTLRPPDYVLDEIFKTSVDFWDLLQKHVDAIRTVMAGEPADGLAGNYRSADTGGHLLFRPVGLVNFSKAVGRLTDKYRLPLSEAVATLSKM